MLRVPFNLVRATPTRCGEAATLSRRTRLVAALVGVGLALVLLIASSLVPDERGWGTHQQLGLPPCTFVTVFGVRCPACGMTTSWSLATHARVVEALRTHVAGTLLAALAAVTSATALAAAARGRLPAWLPGENAVVAGTLVMVGLVLLEWMLRLAQG